MSANKQVKAAEADQSNKGILGTFTGKCCDSNVVNNNDMHLGREVFETLVASEEFQRAMKNRHYIGYAGHPEDSDCQEFEHACIVMTDMEIKDDGEIWGTFDLIDTPVGRVIKSFVDAGVNFGISIRGLGEVDMNGEVDPDQFIFRGFDLVTFPAYDDCIPEFKAIAASTDTKKKAQFKKICASIDNNLKDINSCEALELIQEQLPDGSDEFNKVQDRINELTIEVTDETDEVENEKLNALTELYLDATDKIRTLEVELAEEQIAKNDLIIECKTLKQKQARLNKIAASQLEAATDEIEINRKKAVTASKKARKARNDAISLRNDLRETKLELAEAEKSYEKQVTANTRLQERYDSLKEQRKVDLDSIRASDDLNLKYKQKIEANSEAISQKDSAIEELKSELDKTVVKCQTLESKASNLDEKNGELLSRVEAAEEMVSSYQQAYANLYANALGVYLKGLQITATTSVEELTEMIKGGTSTANIAASPDYYQDDEDEEYVDEEDVFDDVTEYSADLVTL